MRKITCFILLVLTTFFSYSQIKEFGIFAGGTYYIGDLNRVHATQQDFALGGIYKKDMPNNRVSLRFQLMYSQVKSSDYNSGISQQINRNLSFRSSVIEFGPVVEVDFFPFVPGQNNPEKGSYGTPYFFGGINYMRMNPKTKYNGEWVELQPLGTEGQETSFNLQKKYSLNQIVIPFGIGVKVNLSHHSSLSFEYGMRKTFTDYLDDVSGLYPDLNKLQAESGPLAAELSDRSFNPEGINQSSYGLQRGNSTDKDWYMVSGIVLTYEFFNDSSCPKW